MRMDCFFYAVINIDEDETWGFCRGMFISVWDCSTGLQTMLTVVIILLLTVPRYCGTCSVDQIIRVAASQLHLWGVIVRSLVVWFQASFEPQGSRFTNFYYCYYFLALCKSQPGLKNPMDYNFNLLDFNPPKNVYVFHTELGTIDQAHHFLIMLTSCRWFCCCCQNSILIHTYEGPNNRCYGCRKLNPWARRAITSTSLPCQRRWEQAYW